MLEEIVLSLYSRPSVLGVAVDATAAPGSPRLVSEIPDLVPDLEDQGMHFSNDVVWLAGACSARYPSPA